MTQMVKKCPFHRICNYPRDKKFKTQNPANPHGCGVFLFLASSKSTQNRMRMTQV